jgi:uncharacterized membrane-anchored protein
MRKACLLILVASILAGSAAMITYRETQLARGIDALLPLAPRDPRALMTGDYMALEYEVNTHIARALREWRHSARPSPRRAVLRLVPPREREGKIPGLLVYARLDDGSPLEYDEVFLAFTTWNSRVVSAAPAFYFQEGHADAYEQARYGRLRLDPSGVSLLIALCDEAGQPVQVD